MTLSPVDVLEDSLQLDAEKTELRLAVYSAEGRLLVALDGVQDPGNLGTILRTADAAGFAGALLGAGTADPFGPKALSATKGSVFRLRMKRCPELAPVLEDCARRGMAVVASELGGEVWVVDADGSGNGFLTVISRDGDMTEGIVVIVDSLNGAVDLHRGLLLTRPLTFKGKLCRQLSQTVVVEDLPEVQGLGLDSALELSGGIHGALYIHLSSTRLYQRL